MPTHQSIRVPDPHTLLAGDHDRIHEICTGVLDAYGAGDWNVVRSLWHQLEAAVASHFGAEETHVLPLFETFDPAEARALRSEHAELRRRLLELSVGVDLHAVNLGSARRFVSDLRAHGHREEALMYGWAQQNLGQDAREAIEARLASQSGARAGDPASSAVQRRD